MIRDILDSVSRYDIYVIGMYIRVLWLTTLYR